MYAIEVRCHQGRVWLGVIRTFVSVQLFLQVWSVPLGAIIESPRSERASEEEAVNAMKWKQLKEGERGPPDGAEHVRLSLPLLAGPAVINLSKTQQYNRAMKKAPRTR